MNYSLKKLMAWYFFFGFALILKAQPGNLASQASLQPFYIGDDGGAFYIHADGKKIRGIGEHPNNKYSIAFWGKKEGNKISGNWWSLSKYTTKDKGTFEAKLLTTNKLQIIKETGGFPAAILNPKPLSKSIQLQLPYKKVPAWESSKTDNITGAYKSTSKNVICYTRQIGSMVRMYCESKASGAKKPAYAYLFLGRKKEAGKVEGKVYSISKGKQKGSSKATFYIKNENKLTASSSFDLGGNNWKRVHPNYRKKINGYLSGKANNPDNLLKHVRNPSDTPKAVGDPDLQHSNQEGGVKQCKVQQWSFSKNIIDQTVLNEIDLFPGAMVKINQNFVKGEPVILSEIPPAKRTFSITRLAGFSQGKESFSIANLNRSNYQAQLNNRLNWWRNNSQVPFSPNTGDESSEFSWSRDQFLMNIGVNYFSPSVKVATSVSHEKTSESYVFNAYARYDFFSVLVDQPKTPADWFKSGTTLNQVKAVHKNKKMSLGYVNKVTYGAVMLVSFEFDSKQSFTKITAAVNAITTGGTVDADVETEFNKVVKNVKIRYKTTGGNLTPLDHNGSIHDIIRQYNEIKKNLTQRSDPGQGVPVSYQVKFLKNNKIAKIGQTTDYEAAKCEVTPDFISVEVGGHFTGAFRLMDGDGNLIDEKIMKKGRKAIKIPTNTIFPLTMEIKTRAYAQAISSNGNWNFFKKFSATPGCHYRMGGASQNKADLVIQECDEN